MLKITLTNPNTQATETYDVVKEFNPMFERAKELGLISSIPALMIIGHFFPGEVAENQVSWSVWASIGVGMAHIVSLFVFFCVIYRQDTKKRKQYDDE